MSVGATSNEVVQAENNNITWEPIYTGEGNYFIKNIGYGMYLTPDNGCSKGGAYSFTLSTTPHPWTIVKL
ncbi:MAG: hypothetical protein HQK53_18095 [Oligoflexia bacterium]|nr:hypothetical protein [Oligoflexia bacterium]